MPSLGSIFKKYTGPLRQLKLVYVLNNLLNRKKLQHNRALYDKYGVQKNIFSPIGSHNLPEEPAHLSPWLDRPGAKANLQQHPSYAAFSPSIQQELDRFVDDGYMILNNFFDAATIDSHNQEIERLRKQQEVDFNYTGRKIMNAFQQSELIDQQFFRYPPLLKLLSFALGKTVIPFQTINFVEGSEQRAHSDSIHMTTYPKGYLIAIWVALEDCDANNGPLFYYPKSHRLPYILGPQFPSGNSYFTVGAHSNKRYEDQIEQVIQAAGLQPKIFKAQKGDVLVWHANLLHGGSPIHREGATRKSMVAHYYAEDVICYHEISQRPALLDLP
ncbi:MAG: phytanoyl-CoA dioxygenase family protein [Bacteroidota bacterium]